MITFVYCCICLLIVCCQTTRIENEDYDYTNDSPNVLPKRTFSRYRIGSDVLMRCNNHHHNKDNITWEFKHCKSSFKGIQCDKKNMYKLDSEGGWKKLDFSKSKKKLEIRNVTEENIGIYRCLNNDSIIQIYVVDVVVAPKYIGPPPEVVSLIPSPNSTIFPSTALVIQCKIKSTMPPEIRWFKECNGRKCDIKENGNCYCTISTSSNSGYAISNNVHLSKLSIYNTRNIDSGVYFCLVMSENGRDYKNITIKVQDLHSAEDKRGSFSVLFLIPLCFVLVPVTIWLCFYRRKMKNRRLSEHQKQLIKPVVKVDIVLEADDAS